MNQMALYHVEAGQTRLLDAHYTLTENVLSNSVDKAGSKTYGKEIARKPPIM